MAEIYLGSTLTIAATVSKDSAGGYFFNRWTSQSGGPRTDIETFEISRNSYGNDFKVVVRQSVDNGRRRMYGYLRRRRQQRHYCIVHGLFRKGS
jgi:hypothetical protein